MCNIYFRLATFVAIPFISVMVDFDTHLGPVPKYSIIIPTFNHFDDCFKPCIDSILDNTVHSETEIIVVANGCTDGTVTYAKSLTGCQIRVVELDTPVGYTVAVNIGLGVARGEYVVLVNNDVKILEWGANSGWLDELRKPFDTDRLVGITGPKKIMSEETGRPFIIFFLAMIRRETFYKIGYLDEVFNPGGCEDIDFCMRLEQNGYKCVAVPDDSLRSSDYVTTYPVYHAGEATVHSDVAEWENKFQSRLALIKNRMSRFYYSNHADVTCTISTKGRYFTTLPMTIMSVIGQTLKPKRLVIFMDDHKVVGEDLRNHSVYRHLFQMLQDAGISWNVVFGDGIGQVANHQKALDMADTEYIWRIDDDNFAEPDVLRKLMSNFADGVGAVAGSVVTPGQMFGISHSSKMSDIYTAVNTQWVKGDGLVDAEHLYSSFVYRRCAGAHGYCTELSQVGHREETIFTHEMMRAGWKLLIDRSAVTHHLREDSGGIRDASSDLWASDEAVFAKKLIEWETPMRRDRWVYLNCGLGDHWVFRMILDEVKSAYPDDNLVLAVCYPNVFDGVSGVKLVSIDDALSMLGSDRVDKMNVYMFGEMERWKGTLIDAFRELYVKGKAWS